MSVRFYTPWKRITKGFSIQVDYVNISPNSTSEFNTSGRIT
jgi:hypothetical protein